MLRLRLGGLRVGTRTGSSHLPPRCPYSLPAVVLGIAGVLVLVATMVLILVTYASLPVQIPTHFDYSGNPDAYGSRSSLWFLFAIDALVFTLIAVTAHFPRYWNIPIQVYEHNVWAICNATRIFLYVMNLLMALLFGYVIFMVIFNMAISWFFYVFLALIILATPIYIAIVSRF